MVNLLQARLKAFVKLDKGEGEESFESNFHFHIHGHSYKLLHYKQAQHTPSTWMISMIFYNFNGYFCHTECDLV